MTALLRSMAFSGDVAISTGRAENISNATKTLGSSRRSPFSETHIFGASVITLAVRYGSLQVVFDPV